MNLDIHSAFQAVPLCCEPVLGLTIGVQILLTAVETLSELVLTSLSDVEELVYVSKVLSVPRSTWYTSIPLPCCQSGLGFVVNVIQEDVYCLGGHIWFKP
jgi:hypothetical protein